MISLALTNFNRTTELYHATSNFLKDERISEIIISDDHSTFDCYSAIKEFYTLYKKVRIYRNEINLGVYFNKKRSIELCSNPFVIVGDSDNFYPTDSYINKIFEQQWDKDTIFAPDFARPNFSYQAFADLLINKENVKAYLDKPMFSTMLNTFNFFINRNSYLDVFDDSIEPITFDSIYFNYCWLKANKKIKVVKGMQYDHLVHEGSHFSNNVHKSGNLLIEIENKIKEL